MEKIAREEMFEKVKISFGQFEYQYKTSGIVELSQEEKNILMKIMLGSLNIINPFLQEIGSGVPK